jgi:hypothetical protein
MICVNICVCNTSAALQDCCYSKVDEQIKLQIVHVIRKCKAYQSLFRWACIYHLAVEIAIVMQHIELKCLPNCDLWPLSLACDCYRPRHLEKIQTLRLYNC